MAVSLLIEKGIRSRRGSFVRRTGVHPALSARCYTRTMKITKYTHACLDIREGNSRLLVDPGVYSQLPDVDKVTALVVTHMHQDHYDEAKVKQILSANPNVHIFAPGDLASQMPQATNLITVQNGSTHHVGDFNLAFFGDQHATIDESLPVCENASLLVNDTFYYPGDSLTACPKPYKVLAVPTMAPWLKFSDAVPFIEASPATTVFPTHNGFINADGQALYDRLFGAVCENNGKRYVYLAPGESLD